MGKLKHAFRKAANLALRFVPPPLARQVLKSYASSQSLQNRLHYHVVPFRYDTPIADFSEINLVKLAAKRPLSNLIPDLAVFDALINQLKPYAPELQPFPNQPGGDSAFWFHNGGYEDFDAITLYTLLRHLKPQRMIEVGCGYSSRLTTLAATKNRAEGSPLECLFVEPFPPQHLLDFKLAGELIVDTIQNVPLAKFAALKSGDVLFIDTTHVLKPQSDLSHIFHEILPALAPGVYLHFHDIFTPYDYPGDWLLRSQHYFNEQYVLEAVLCNHSGFEVVLPVHALWRDRLAKLSELLPGGQTQPAAFWIRKKA